MVRKPRQEAGFTLIELLVVVVIIGILASVAIPNFVGAQDKAKNSGVQSNGHRVQMALEQYAVDTSGVYPTGLSAIIGTNNNAYMGQYPKTPWNTTQANATDIATVSSLTLNSDLGAGTAATPTGMTNFGAVGYNSTGNASESYALYASGKRGSNAMLIFYTGNGNQ